MFAPETRIFLHACFLLKLQWTSPKDKLSIYNIRTDTLFAVMTGRLVVKKSKAARICAGHGQPTGSQLDRRSSMARNPCKQIISIRTIATSGQRTNPIDVDDEDSNSPVESVSSSITKLQSKNRKLRQEKEKLLQTIAGKTESIVRLRYQQQQEERQDRENRAASSFATNHTTLVDLGNPDHLAESSRKANQEAKAQIREKKSASRQAQQARSRPNRKRPCDEDINEYLQPNPKNHRTATSQPPNKKKKPARQPASRTRARNDKPDPSVVTEDSPRHYPLRLGAPLSIPRKADKLSNRPRQPESDSPSQSHISVVLLRETADIDITATIDISTGEALIKERERFQFLNDQDNINLSLLRTALREDHAKLQRMYSDKLDWLFPQDNGSRSVPKAVTVKCLRGYLRQRSPQAEKLDGSRYTCQSCCEQNSFCYSLVSYKGSNGKEGLLAVTLPLAPAHRSKETLSDQEAFYCRGGDLFMSGAL